MLDFFETLSAIGVLYEHVKDYIAEEDFWLLTKDQYAKMPEAEQSETLFMINPSKLKTLNKSKGGKPEIYVVNESEKQAVLKTIDLIQKKSSALPETSSFLERLLYAKKALPSFIFKL